MRAFVYTSGAPANAGWRRVGVPCAKALGTLALRPRKVPTRIASFVFALAWFSILAMDPSMAADLAYSVTVAPKPSRDLRVRRAFVPPSARESRFFLRHGSTALSHRLSGALSAESKSVYKSAECRVPRRRSVECRSAECGKAFLWGGLGTTGEG